MYFGSIEYVNVQTTAILSYIDPVTALLLSVLVLNENMTLNSLHEILMWCQENEVNDVIFSEHELNKITINQVQDLVNNYDVNVYISVNK